MRNRFHSICPYFAMFPEDFAAGWIDRLSRPGDVVFDPFSGRGTTPFQAVLMNRRGVGCDINPVAYCLTRAKVNSPELSKVRGRLTYLENRYEPSAWESRAADAPEFFRTAFTSGTLAQLIYLRSRLKWESSPVDAMIAALILGCLHGESERSDRYLSAQMPRTISTKPDYSLRFWSANGFAAPDRDVFARMRVEAAYRYRSQRPEMEGYVFRSDMREAPRRLRERALRARLIVTSPPYMDTTSFEEDQWLRIWFLGGSWKPRRGVLSPDDRHRSSDGYWRFIADFWRMAGKVLAPEAHVIVRLGGRRHEPEELVAKLSTTAMFAGRAVRLVSHETSAIRGRQTDAFRPGTKGCRFEVDCCYAVT